jgi:Protein of unknown function (DUF2612)
MVGDIAPYTGLVTSEHAVQPNFMAFLAALVQPLADIMAVVSTIDDAYDLDLAIGQQLDVIGLWANRSRYLEEPLTGVYFALDTVGVGLDQGYWQGEFDPTQGLVALDDDTYRIVLRAAIASNSWDGTIPGAYGVLNILFAATETTVLIQDNQDMTITVGLVGETPTATAQAILQAGVLEVKPAGVLIEDIVSTILPEQPLFGLDAETPTVAGLDTGSWAMSLPLPTPVGQVTFRAANLLTFALVG